MKLATFTPSDQDAPRAGEVRDDTVVAFDDGLSVLDRLRSGDRTPASGPSFPLADVTLLAPHDPRAIFCIGWNYKAHIEETGRDLPEFPVVFLKLPNSAAPPNGVVTCPKVIRRLDYEVELTIVMGAGGEIAGYTVADDVSGRDLQRREPQWTRAKGADTFCPFGPWITTADEVPEPENLRLRSWVNGEPRQDSRTNDLLFGIEYLVNFISETCTLESGDLILTGTPSGVGFAMDPPQFLKQGDVVRMEIESLGVIEHTIAGGVTAGARGGAPTLVTMALAGPQTTSPERGASDVAEQQRVAVLSVFAAVFLVTVKLATGLVTGSLGLIAEAAHSGTDLVAALLTLFAVRIAVRPADQEHHYGHGKAEHLAALAESSFLMLISAFLAFQAVDRLASDTTHHVQTTWWSFLVLAVVIGVDASRAVVTQRAARRHHSPALASNALHFASDLAGSLAVLVGLVLVALGEPRADAIAALIVAALVLVAAARLARQSIEVLMDRADADSEAAVEAALAEFGDLEVRRLRSRHAAGRDFVDLVVAVSADAGLAQAHTTADQIEDAIRRQLPNSDVLVHVEPRAAEGDLRERATAAALGVPEVREVHNVRVLRLEGGPELSLHVKLPRELQLGAAHAVVERLEATLHEAVPELRRVDTHIEPLSETDWATRPARDEVAEAREAIEDVVSRYTGRGPAKVSFRDADRGRVALIDVLLPADQPLPSAHRRAGDIEEAVRARCPELADVIVHTEPATASTPTG